MRGHYGVVQTLPAQLRQRGAALLLAMMTVALVATLAAAALWQQWRNIEIEARERDRLQASWILIGALDWARLILREDGRSGGPDHLAEPWSIPLSEARLSSFLAMKPGDTELGDNGFLSGQITDAQARLNVTNLVVANAVSESDLKAFERLFAMLGIDPIELEQLVANLQLALKIDLPQDRTIAVPLMPRRVEQLRWLGMSATSLLVLEPYITLLPARTPVNLNTASAEVIAARISGIDMSDARNLVAVRARTPFSSITDVAKVLPAGSGPLNPAEVGVASRFFEVRGLLRLAQTEVMERSLVLRNGITVTTIWREREARDPRAPSAAQR